jgi:hypothetical protein
VIARAAVGVALVAVQAAPVAAAAAAARGELTPTVVLLLAGPDAEPLAGRLAAELAAVGLEVQREEPPEDQAPDPVASALRARATAAVWALPGGAAAEVWVLDRANGRALIRQSINADGEGMAPLVALRTVEFLRASLLGLPGPAPPVADTSETPTGPPGLRQEATTPTAAAPRLSAVLGAGFLASPGNVDPMASIDLALRARLIGRLGIEALALLHVTSPTVTEAAGSSTVAVNLVGMGLTARLAGARRGALDVGAGGMAVFMHSQGTAVGPGLTASAPNTWATALYARLGLGLLLTSTVGVRAEIISGATTQHLGVNIGDTKTQAAEWGRPFASAFVGLEARLP